MDFMVLLSAVIMVIVGFFSGSIMYSYLLPKLMKGIDVRQIADDQNPGGANAIKAGGKTLGIVCILLDIVKAYIPVYIAIHLLSLEGWLLIPVILAPVMGHAYSPFLHFRGGKAIASTYGSLLSLWGIYTSIVLVLALTMVVFTLIITIKPNAVRVCISFLAASLFAVWLDPWIPAKLIMPMLTVLSLIKHRHELDIRNTHIMILPMMHKKART